MKKEVIISVSILAIFIGCVTGMLYATQVKIPAQPLISAITEQPLIEYVNKVRADNGVAPLTEDAGLDQSAKIKGDDMAERNYWEHTTPDGEQFYLNIQRVRPGLKWYGENLAECYQSNSDTIAAWIASPGHLANIVKPEFTLFGTYSVFDNDKNCLITVNHFGA